MPSSRGGRWAPCNVRANVLHRADYLVAHLATPDILRIRRKPRWARRNGGNAAQDGYSAHRRPRR
jgi:hypothetical protein